MAFRLAEDGDEDALASLLCEHIEFIWNKPIAASEREAMRKFYAESYCDASTVIVVYVDEISKKVIATGTVGIIQNVPRRGNIFGFITDITVTNTHRGNGLGSGIFKFLLKQCMIRKVNSLILTANEVGAKVYRNFGFVEPKKGVKAMETHITTYPKTTQSSEMLLKDTQMNARIARSADLSELRRLKTEMTSNINNSSLFDFKEEFDDPNPLIAVVEDKNSNLVAMAYVGYGKGTMYGSEFPTSQNYLTGWGLLYDIYVTPLLRRQKVGTAVVGLLLQQLERLKVGYLILSSPNESAQKFFEQFSFQAADDPDSFGMESTWDSYTKVVTQ
jgi:GNAT superfamily N-acetyltransferase